MVSNGKAFAMVTPIYDLFQLKQAEIKAKSKTELNIISNTIS